MTTRTGPTTGPTGPTSADEDRHADSEETVVLRRDQQVEGSPDRV